jgi:hypothetical protein
VGERERASVREGGRGREMEIGRAGPWEGEIDREKDWEREM